MYTAFSSVPITYAVQYSDLDCRCCVLYTLGMYQVDKVFNF